MNVADWPGSGGRLQAALIGIPVQEHASLAYDEMITAPFGMGRESILVGECNHFMYRMHMLELNDQCRENARRHIEATATRILGEEWKVSS